MYQLKWRIAAVAVLLPSLALAARADIKITTKTTAAGHSFQSTVYIKASRQRTEALAGMVSIFQCDLSRMIQLNDNSRKYIVTELHDEDESASAPAAKTSNAEPAPQTRTRKGGIVTFVISMSDTGERKQMFGYTARHIKTTMSKEASPDACDPRGMKIETDGWYIDFEYSLHCVTERSAIMPAQRGPASRPECQDEIRFRRTGGGRPGYPIDVTTTVYADDGKTFSTRVEVTELSTATLADSLFDIPAGYTEVANYGELMGMPSIGSLMRQRQTESTGPASEAAPAADTGAKAPGGIRVGVVAIANKTQDSFELNNLRDHLISNLRGPALSAVALDATSSDDITAEARQKQCDYVLYTTVTDLKKPSTTGKIGTMLGHHLGKDKYEVKLTYLLFPTGGSAPLLNSDSSGKDESSADTAISYGLDPEARAVVRQVSTRR